MAVNFDFKRLKTSWTKYDIVRVMGAVYSVETIEQYIRGDEVVVNSAILKAFLGVDDLRDPIPAYWMEIQYFPEVKKLFALLATIFTHWEVVSLFVKNSKGNMKGVFRMQEGKEYTNIRRALIDSGAASPTYEKADRVPYDFSPILQNPPVGGLFKQVLLQRISKITDAEINDAVFYEICFKLKFHKALSLTEDQFKTWMGGAQEQGDRVIKSVSIANFFSIDNVNLEFDNAREIYFLGENGDGKSLILMGIYLAFNGNFIANQTDLEKTGKAVDILRNNKDFRLSGLDEDSISYNPQAALFLKNLFAYGTHRGRYSTDKPEEYGFMSLFDSDQTLVNPVSWLKDQKMLGNEKSNHLEEGGDEHDFPGMYPMEMLERLFFDLLERNVEITIGNAEVSFKEKGIVLNFDQLSEGYKSIVIFVADLLYRLTSHLETGEDSTKQKGVVLVDEIDLHLHPRWQRHIVGKLRSIFPNIQFIFTTHSPTIIQGASQDALIYRVYRADGKTRVSDAYRRKDLDHLMINTLLTSPLFGLEDSRMDPNDNNADTSDTYILYRINQKMEEYLQKQRAAGKDFISDAEIDNLIETLINNELNRDDKA